MGFACVIYNMCMSILCLNVYKLAMIVKKKMLPEHFAQAVLFTITYGLVAVVHYKVFCIVLYSFY